MISVFLDSDVVISSLISQAGASYQLINNKKITCYISNISYKELLLVTLRLSLNDNKLKKVVKEKFTLTKLSQDLNKIKLIYGNCVKDIDDAHIIAGAAESRVDYLVTFNIKDFKINKIKEKYHIKIMTPGTFLQFLRNK